MSPDIQRRLHDAFLILLMAVLAACGLIYEYLLSHYAGRVLGAVETAIYTMIGLMIVSMGLGAFAARYIKSIYTGFIFLELTIAILGASGILLIAGLIALTELLPSLVADTFILPADVHLVGGIFQSLREFSRLLPYILGSLLGFFIGMEIPLIANIRQQQHSQILEHNAGTIYGADYIGAGCGAALWVTVMLNLDINQAAVYTATANLLVGALFCWVYRRHLKQLHWVIIGHGVAIAVLAALFIFGGQWQQRFSNTLFRDEVVIDLNTHYQHLTVTQRLQNDASPSVLNLHINGRLQFSSEDEHIYHSFLVHPAMSAMPYAKRVLIIGGGDGLALRDVLRWPVDAVTLLDLDPMMTALFRGDEINPAEDFKAYQQRFVRLNDAAFSDKRVSVINQDAFVFVDELLRQNQHFDVILVDLPDPNHPDLNKMYSDHFYRRLSYLLTGDGVMTVQATSPYHAQAAFLSILNTLQASGFSHASPYHGNVPSFGEWGWISVVKNADSVPRRLFSQNRSWASHDWLTEDLLKGAFAFPADFFQLQDLAMINYLGSNRLYQYHLAGWQGKDLSSR